MGLFMGLDAEAYDREYPDRVLIARIATYFAKHRRKVVTVGVLIAFMGGLGAVPTLLISSSVDSLAIISADAILLLLVGTILFVGVLNWFVNWVRRRLTQRVIGDIVLAMRTDAFNASVSHDMSFYDEFKTGRIISRITSDTQEFGQVVILITDLISQLILLAVLLPILFTVEWHLALMLVALMPFIAGVALGFRKIARRVTQQGVRAMGEVNASIQEAVTGIQIAKNFRQENTIYNEFTEVNKLSYKINLKRGFVLATVFPLLNILSGLAIAILLFYGARAAAEGVISIGALFLFTASVDRFWFPMMGLSAFWAQFQNGLSATERIFALIDATPVVHQIDNQPAPKLQGEIHFDKMHFRYSTQERVLENFTLHIKAGESVALVGHTGAGKSSIAKLIARFYEYQAGALHLDGHDIRSFDLHSYRRQLGMVSQTPFLFSGTVAENISYGQSDLSDEEIESIARRIGEGEWIDTLPDGLATDVGERGSHLSMGQRQLVALARVLAQRPAIFILDEATASIDPFTESQIKEALDLILANSTSILIAHRLSTVKAVDRIVVLREGEIIEEGSHDQLMASGGHYAELYDTYFRHQSPDYLPPPVDATASAEAISSPALQKGK